MLIDAVAVAKSRMSLSGSIQIDSGRQIGVEECNLNNTITTNSILEHKVAECKVEENIFQMKDLTFLKNVFSMTVQRAILIFVKFS